ncbi:MAG TPA: pyridoxine 5'-phosphate synthase [Nevskiaceae bacterium]
MSIRLGVNVDHVATLRQARGTDYPDPVAAARECAQGGADGITIHLREDRRHIQDEDLRRMLREQSLPVNLEMAATDEIVALACAQRPACVCLVPERRQELTTEGGLDVALHARQVRDACRRLANAGIAVSLFIDPEARQLEATLACGAPHVEIHTGRYANLPSGVERKPELARIAGFARDAAGAGLEVHAGHGLTLDNVAPIAAIPEVVELNIGHSLVARALFVGLRRAVEEMRRAMQGARS